MDPDAPPPIIAEENTDIPPYLIRKRALELALMDGRGEDAVTDADLRRAEADLTPGGTDEVEWPEDTLNPEDAAVSTGAQHTTVDEEDPQPDLVELVESGVDRAVEDEMISSGRETVAEGEDMDASTL